MVVRSRARVRFWFSIVALLAAPAALQGYSCSPATGDATLSSLEVEVQGQNHISAFSSGERTYNVWLPLSADSAIVRAYSTDPNSQVSYNLAAAGASGYIDSGYFPNGGGEITLAGLLPEGRSELRINVKALPPRP